MIYINNTELWFAALHRHPHNYLDETVYTHANCYFMPTTINLRNNTSRSMSSSRRSSSRNTECPIRNVLRNCFTSVTLKQNKSIQYWFSHRENRTKKNKKQKEMLPNQCNKAGMIDVTKHKRSTLHSNKLVKNGKTKILVTAAHSPTSISLSLPFYHPYWPILFKHKKFRTYSQWNNLQVSKGRAKKIVQTQVRIEYSSRIPNSS